MPPVTWCDLNTSLHFPVLLSEEMEPSAGEGLERQKMLALVASAEALSDQMGCSSII
uniref:Uncharacterized protein n=1 Tax=Anguilla anguilla TaxID=7936 RepID=A0A0E9QNS1_ANGAN